jgi:RHS repeat-associated protein
MNIRNFLTRCVVALVAMSVGTQALAARTTTYYHNDALGSVVAASSETGQVLWRKHYAPFGEQLDAPPPTSDRTAYTGKQHDDVIGLTYFGGRNFDPELGRFVSVDPVGFVDDNTMSFNRYLYVNNNPYKYVDPDGEFLNFAAKFVLDVALGVAINYATTGSLGIGMALKDSAMGILNPAKTLAKAGKLASLLAKTKKVEKAVEKVHKNSRKFDGETHVYAVRKPDGSLYKIGESAQGVRKADGASKRAESQVRKLNRKEGLGHSSEIRKTFPNKDAARDYETRVIERYRRMYGQDKLPGNKTNR